MGHTSEQRDKHALCGAKSRTTGNPCRKFAGEGTDHRGYGNCKYHGGNSPNGKKYGLKLEAKRRMVTLGAPIDDISPEQALLAVLRATAGHVSWLHGEIGLIEDVSSCDAEVIFRLYDTERDRLARIGDACARAGIAEWQVKVAASQVEVIGRSLAAACEQAGLSEAQRRAVGAALRKELAAHAAESPEVASLYDSAR
jgi:hypothetical protein